MSRPYHYGLVIGRFQPLHKGHENLITEALMLCDAVVVYIDSKSDDRDNPFGVADRIAMFQKVFAGNIQNKTLIIKDIDLSSAKDNISLAEYIFDRFKLDFGCLPNLCISGNESLRSRWFNNNIFPSISELIISKKRTNISSTELRDYFRENDMENCVKNMSEKLASNMDYMKRIVSEN